MRIFTFHSLLLFTAVAPFAVSATKRRSTRNASCLPFPHRQPSNNNISIPTSFVTSMSSRPCAGDVITKCKLMRIDAKLGTAARTRRNICQLRNDVSDERDDGCDGMDYSSGLKSGQNTFNNRRAFLLSSSSILAASSIFGMPLYANAAKGAAEYDLEYYFRDIV